MLYSSWPFQKDEFIYIFLTTQGNYYASNRALCRHPTQLDGSFHAMFYSQFHSLRQGDRTLSVADWGSVPEDSRQGSQRGFRSRQ